MWMRWSLLCLSVVLVISAAAIPARSQGVTEKDPKGTKPANTEKATDDRITNCTIKLDQEVILSTERPGILDATRVKEGDEVEKGAVLAQINADVPQAALAVATTEADSDIDIRYAIAAADVAEKELEKANEANAGNRKVVPDVEVQRARLAAVKAKLEIEKATHIQEVNRKKVEEAAVQVRICQVTAPFDGFVSKIHVSKGATLRQGDPLIELIHYKTLRVEGFATEEQVNRIAVGSTVWVMTRPKGNNKEVEPKEAKIRFIDKKSNLADNRVRIWAELDNSEGKLRSGWSAEIHLVKPDSKQSADKGTDQ